MSACKLTQRGLCRRTQCASSTMLTVAYNHPNCSRTGRMLGCSLERNSGQGATTHPQNTSVWWKHSGIRSSLVLLALYNLSVAVLLGCGDLLSAPDSVQCAWGRGCRYKKVTLSTANLASSGATCAGNSYVCIVLCCCVV